MFYRQFNGAMFVAENYNMVYEHIVRFILVHNSTLFPYPRSEHDIRNNTCFSCFGVKDHNVCGSCSAVKPIIKTWCNPRGRCYQHPEALIVNQKEPYGHIFHSWNVTRRNPIKLHPSTDFNESIYDGYLDSLLISLLVQFHNKTPMRSFSESERHPFDLNFWKDAQPLLVTVLHELSSSMKYPETLSILTMTTLTLHGINGKSSHYYGENLWNKALFPKFFDNYEITKQKFIELFPENTSYAGSLLSPQAVLTNLEPVQASANTEAVLTNLEAVQASANTEAVLTNPEAVLTNLEPVQAPANTEAVLTNLEPVLTNQVSLTPQLVLTTQAPQGPQAMQTTETPNIVCDLMNTFDAIPTPGSLFNYLKESTTPEHTSRKRHIKNIYSNMNILTSNDIISMLLEKNTHVFKNTKIQKLFESYDFQAETLNLRMFGMFMGAVTPDDVTDMNAIYDHVGTYMLVKK